MRVQTLLAFAVLAGSLLVSCCVTTGTPTPIGDPGIAALNGARSQGTYSTPWGDHALELALDLKVNGEAGGSIMIRNTARGGDVQFPIWGTYSGSDAEFPSAIGEGKLTLVRTDKGELVMSGP